jgi:hypothetical protein
VRLLLVHPLWSFARSRSMSGSGRPSGRLPHDPTSQNVGEPRSCLTLRAALAVALVVSIAACSSDDDGADPSTSVTRSAAASEPSTAAPPTPTMQAPLTSVTAATTAPTSATRPPTTSIAPTSTEPADPEAAIRHAVAAATDAFTQCLLALPNCDPATLADTREGPLLAVNTERVNEWNGAGYEVRDRDQFRYVIESVEIDPSGTTATVVVCVADGSKLVLPSAGPGSTDVIVDGTYVSGRESWDMRLGADGVWRVYDAPALGPTESTDVCPPG